MTEFRIEKVVAGGYSLARDGEGKVIFLTRGYPGELVRAKKIRTSKGFTLWEATEIIEPSPERCSASCGSFPECGGCDWQDSKYESQLNWKGKIIEEQFKRIGKIELPETPEVVPSPQKNYRTRMEYLAFNSEGKIKLGFYKKLSNIPVVSDGCILGLKSFEEIKKSFEAIFSELKIPVYDWKKKRGILKHLVLRGNISGDVMAIIVTKKDNPKKINELKSLVEEWIPEVKSLVHVFNSNDNIVLRGPHRILFGEDVLTEQLDWFTYQVPPTSFFQNNIFVTEKLLEYVKKIINPDPNETLLDLYCGVGTFSIYMAPYFKSVTSVESVKTSTNALKANCNINDLHNIKIINSTSEDFIENHDSTFDAVILDPPRGGMGKDASKLPSTGARSIVYVSCNTATLARDVSFLLKKGYTLESVKGFDMFPQTHHVECVVLMSRV